MKGMAQDHQACIVSSLLPKDSTLGQLSFRGCSFSSFLSLLTARVTCQAGVTAVRHSRAPLPLPELAHQQLLLLGFMRHRSSSHSFKEACRYCHIYCSPDLLLATCCYLAQDFSLDSCLDNAILKQERGLFLGMVPALTATDLSFLCPHP